MALAGKLAGIVSSVLVFVMLAGAGCQEQRAEPAAPTTGPQAASTPAGVDTRENRPREETPVPPVSQAAPDVKQEKAEPAKPEPSGPAVELVLKFVPERATTYRITTEYQRSIEWKGSPSAKPKPGVFTDGRTGNHIELTFEQRVMKVQDDGNALLEITIKGLKYVREVENKVVLSFDSSKPEDSENPLAVLIGKGYQVKMSPKGQVVEIANVEPARQAMLGGLPGQNVALRLLSDNEIRDRHEIVALSALKDPQVRPGQTWSSVRTFSFDDLGAKSYERVYTLKQAGRVGLAPPEPVGTKVGGASPTLRSPTANAEGRLAVVEMKAIPSAALAEELHKRQRANPLARMSDNADSYQGRLVLDLDSGQVREYGEEMRNEWIIADPASVEGQLAALRMAAWRLQRLERVQ